jgi:hypothetical protein
MQEQIRAMTTSAFPEVDKFVALHQGGELREPAIVARDLWALLGRGHVNGAVLDLRDPEE